MTRDEIKAVVEVGNDRRFRITFPDGVTQSVDVAAVHEEGVLHSGSGRKRTKGMLDAIRKYRGHRAHSNPLEVTGTTATTRLTVGLLKS